MFVSRVKTDGGGAGASEIDALPFVLGLWRRGFFLFHTLAPMLRTPMMPRHYTDIFVTEHGIARLKGRTLRDRVNELIGIAHPGLLEIEGYTRRPRPRLDCCRRRQPR
jgi:hypothetical protein